MLLSRQAPGSTYGRDFPRHRHHKQSIDRQAALAMILADIKKSSILRRKLFEIERAVEREIIDLWCKEKSYCSENFADAVDVDYKGTRMDVSFAPGLAMKYGPPEATINDMMRGLILTMATEPGTGRLLKNHEAIIGNILDVFVHRLKELGERKFIFRRLQSLELGFSVAFGLAKEFYPIKSSRRHLEEALHLASLSSAEDTATTLIHDMLESETLAEAEHGVTFHIFMTGPDVASFLSLPFGAKQTNYVGLLGTHTLRCNILARVDGETLIQAGVMKIDAPSDPMSFIRHKGLELELDQTALMDKMRNSAGALTAADFTPDELTFLKLLYNEYVQLAWFLLASGRIDPELRILIIFPRINFFKILHEENSAIPPDEPQTLRELGMLNDRLFTLPAGQAAAKKKSKRIPERVIQEKVSEALQLFGRSILKNLYKPLTGIRRSLLYYSQGGYSNEQHLATIKSLMDDISAYLKKLNLVQRFAVDPKTGEFDLEAAGAEIPASADLNALEEIVQNIQAAEIYQTREVIVTKMLDYLSFITVRLEQTERVSTLYIKQEVVREMELYTLSILRQAKAFYRLIMGKQDRKYR